MPTQHQKLKKNVGKGERAASIAAGVGLLSLVVLSAQRKNLLAIPFWLWACRTIRHPQRIPVRG